MGLLNGTAAPKRRSDQSSASKFENVDIDTIEEGIKRVNILLKELFAQDDRGENADYERLRGMPGMCLDPMPWPQAVEAVIDGSPAALATLGRNPLSTKHYFKFREEQILGKYATVLDYLHATVFDLETRPNADNKLEAIVPEDFESQRRIVWKANDFPYNFEPGIEHHVLWSSFPLDIEQLEAEIAKYRGSGWDYVYFVNPTVLKSVPGLWHAHILSKRTEN